MKNKLNLLSFLLPLFEMEMGGGGAGDVAPSPGAGSAEPAVSSTVGEAFGAIPEGEQSTGDVIAPDGDQTAQTEADIFDGVPTLEELQTQVEQKVPHSEALLRLRTELERVKPTVQQFDSWKTVVEGNDPIKVAERLATHDSLFSPKMEHGQRVLDERGLPQTTAQPFFESMEAKRPGYTMSTFTDMMDIPTLNPATGEKEPLISQFFREVLGLDPGKLDQYQNIDSLIAKTNGSITPEELAKVAEPDQAAFKTLPSGLRKDWDYMDEDTRRYHLDGANSRMKADAFMEAQAQKDAQAQQEYQQNFESQVQVSFVQDLAEVREQAFSSLRDNLAKDWQPSTDDAINQDRYDDVLAPLESLIDPDLQPRALARLEREGIKVNAQEFNEQMQSLVTARKDYVRAMAFKDGIAAESALKEYTTLNLKLMSKLSNIVLDRAKRYGYQAKQIADAKGELLTTASQVRPMVPGATALQTFSASGLPAGMDPRSSEAAMLQYRQSTGQA